MWFKNGEWYKDFSHTLCLLSITCLFVMPQDCQAAESALQLHRTPKGREKGREWSFHAVKHSIKLDQNSLIPVWSLWFSLDGHEYSWETKIGTSAWEFWAPWGCTWGNEGALGNAFVMYFLSYPVKLWKGKGVLSLAFGTENVKLSFQIGTSGRVMELPVTEDAFCHRGRSFLTWIQLLQDSVRTFSEKCF